MEIITCAPHRGEHQLGLQLLPQLQRHEDGGHLQDRHHRHQRRVADEGGLGLGGGGGEPQQRDEEEQHADGEDEVGDRGEVAVDGLQVGEEVDVDHDAAQVEARRGGHEQRHIEHADGCPVVAHGHGDAACQAATCNHDQCDIQTVAAGGCRFGLALEVAGPGGAGGAAWCWLPLPGYLGGATPWPGCSPVHSDVTRSVTEAQCDIMCDNYTSLCDKMPVCDCDTPLARLVLRVTHHGCVTFQQNSMTQHRVTAAAEK